MLFCLNFKHFWNESLDDSILMSPKQPDKIANVWHDKKKIVYAIFELHEEEQI